MSDAIGLVMNPVGELHGKGGGRAHPERVMYDALTTCAFLRREIPIVFGSLSHWARSMLEGVCGWKLTEKDWKNLMLRVSIMERCVSIREGYVPTRDDILPDRFFDEAIYSKYGEPKILDRQKFFDVRKKEYLSFGLNEEGVPSKKTLKALEMEFVIPVLEKKLGTLN